MRKATTVLTPREAMIRLAKAWRPLFDDINSHYKVNIKGKVVMDKKIIEDMGIFSSVEKKLKDSFLQQLLNDAKLIREAAKKSKDYRMAQSLLKEIEGLLKSIKRDELVRKRQARYLRILAIKLGGNIRKIENEVRREERRARGELERTFKARKKGIEKQLMAKSIKQKSKAKTLKFPTPKKIKKLAT